MAFIQDGNGNQRHESIPNKYRRMGGNTPVRGVVYLTQHNEKAKNRKRDRPKRRGRGSKLSTFERAIRARPAARGNWEYGTRAERRQRLEYAIGLLRQSMENLDHWARPDADPEIKNKKKPRWEFSP